MQVFIIHFTSLLSCESTKKKSLSYFGEKVGGGRFCNLHEFGLLSIRQPLSVGQ